MKNVLVTNGYVNPEPLAELLPLVDAMNIDLKSTDPAFYRKTCGGNLEPVLATIRTAAKATHVELTTLLYTGHNDTDGQVRNVVDFVAETDREIPLHISRYFPQHRATALRRRRTGSPRHTASPGNGSRTSTSGTCACPERRTRFARSAVRPSSGGKGTASIGAACPGPVRRMRRTPAIRGINQSMERTRPHGLRGILAGPGAGRLLSALLLVLCLLLSLPSTAATDNSKTGTYQDRATAERMSRSRYRDLEVASLVVILVAEEPPSSGRPPEETVT